jgi:YD repeat-containing protein
MISRSITHVLSLIRVPRLHSPIQRNLFQAAEKTLWRQVFIVAIAVFSWVPVLSILTATAPGTAYVYDAAGRLVQATISDGNNTTQIAYVYDQAGNLVAVKTQ